jgi:PAS domain S-box-containing protein
MLSLRRRLPVLISTLLAVAVGVVCWLSYAQVRRVLVEAAETRVDGAARQVAAMLDESLRRMRTEAQAQATGAEIAALLARPSAATHDRAERALLDAPVRNPASRTSHEVWSADGRLLLAIGPLRPRDGDLRRDPPREAGAGPIVPTSEGMLYSIVAPVLGATGDTLGWLATTRTLAAAQGVHELEEMVGLRATLLVGNATGDVWTDFRAPVAGPPAPRVSGAPAQFDLAGERRLGATVPMRSAPWVVHVHTPLALAVAPARRFVVDLVAVALALIALGALGAWLVSRQVTAPLAQVTEAAQDVARGDYARRVSIRRRDEIGSLADSFNTMAERIEASAERLHGHTGELEATNAQLRASEERYRQLVDAAHEGICVVDPAGVITYANRRLAALLGQPDDALHGRSFFELMDRETAFEARTQFARRARGIAETSELPLRRSDGTMLWTNMASSSLFDADGVFTGALLMLSDVTEQRALEAQLRQAQKMEAVGQLAGGVAHDFNNLLTVVSSYSEFLLEGLEPDSRLRGDVEEIRAASRRAANLTRQLLAFSRQQVLRPREMDLGVVVRGMTEMLQRMVGADIRLEARLAPDLAECFADPGQFEHVLMNLVVNARDAMPDGGRITIETANVSIEAASVGRHGHLPPGAYVLLAVSDTGIGMDSATQARVFEPFFTTKRVGEGTGLGLSTVYGIVQQSDGAITVSSAPGIGTTFTVFLPAVPPYEAGAIDEAARGAAMPAGAATRMHASSTPAAGVILVVDDEESVRDVVCRTLAQRGHTVLAAADVAEALALLEDRAQRIDLVVSDVTMPVLGGVSLVEHLARARPGTRAVLMSGFTADALLRRGVLPPSVMFLGKPFTQESLVQTVAAALRGVPAARPTPAHGLLPTPFSARPRVPG